LLSPHFSFIFVWLADLRDLHSFPFRLASGLQYSQYSVHTCAAGTRVIALSVSKLACL